MELQGAHGRKGGRKYTVDRALCRRKPRRERHQGDMDEAVKVTPSQSHSHPFPPVSLLERLGHGVFIATGLLSRVPLS